MKLNLLKDMEAIAFKIGLRTTKTVISVFLCFLLDSMRTGGIPFYATIAAILCVWQDLKNSWTIGKNRRSLRLSAIYGGCFFSFSKVGLSPLSRNFKAAGPFFNADPHYPFFCDDSPA